ncbi:MAG TPA: hypothetical protein VG122_14505 [Gemmata sp.]|nr:hypothetical protein [Gemmata sp.]
MENQVSLVGQELDEELREPNWATTTLEPLFTAWEKKWKQTRKDINNPKIPLTFVETNGTKVYPKPS